ncbi:ATP-grasp fold amidoligase family protein [Campylobacter insulaenigrae]|uniref:ATP-grasp fold amidoligase family protein n=1 Tax=Campylobacter insulaenigrae TaxID=260714 RepID=UPI0021531566|nr:ATP-grasp fold amidoligase family protein [Campylobacter insulaenigrae]MCR6571463.1 glycosyltransferase [Campylobacter insulaenigrae]MCR6583828.1 glycosyltransferase [Campylobacter insulaenigrae]
MLNKPKISVIIPSLNSVNYIQECIDSVLNQTLEDIEIICVDANSTDGTLEILKKYEKRDKRLSVTVSDKKSYGYQINLGIEKARGEYLSIVESDDCIEENMYKILYNVAQKNNCEVVKSDFYLFEGNGRDRKKTYTKLTYLDELYGKVISPLSNKNIFYSDNINPPGIYKLDFIKKNNIKLHESLGASFQDNGLFFQIFTQARRMYFLNQAFYMVRRDNHNSSVYDKGKVYCLCDEYDFIRNFLRKDIFLEKEYVYFCTLFRFYAYNFNLGRIGNEFKRDFLKKYSEDFKKIIKDKEIDYSMFNEDDLQRINDIISDPEKYYFTKVFTKEEKTVKQGVYGAVARIKFQLSYRLGNIFVKNFTVLKLFKILYLIPKEVILFKIERNILKKMIENKLILQPIPLHEYSDYNEALKIKNHLSYKLGEIFLKSPSLFLLRVSKICKEFNQNKKRVFNINLDISDEEFFVNRHKNIFGYIPNFKEPKTFNEKLVYRMLYDRSPFYSFLADKLKVRIYIASILSNKSNYKNMLSKNSILFKDINELKQELFNTNSCKFLPKLYAIYDRVSDIEFDKLPNSFVLKTNHDCGGYVIVRNKKEFLRDINLFSTSIEKLNHHLNLNYYSLSREWQYKNIKPKLFVEELLVNENDQPADTYKFHIFDHKKLDNNYIQVTTDRFNDYKRYIMDIHWNIAPFNFIYDIASNENKPKKPLNFDQMFNISLILSEQFDYVRVDLYCVSGCIYVGELTFTHGAAGEKTNPIEWDNKLGKLWKIRRLVDVTK